TLIALGLYKTSEIFLKKLLEAAWKPAETELENVFTRLAGRDDASARKQAFESAVILAHEKTIHKFNKAEIVFKAFEENINTTTSHLFIEEALNTTLFSEKPNTE